MRFQPIPPPSLLPTSWRLSGHSCSCAATAAAAPSPPAVQLSSVSVGSEPACTGARGCAAAWRIRWAQQETQLHIYLPVMPATPPPSDSLPSVHNPTSRRWPCPSRNLLCRQHWALQPDDHASGPVRPGGPLPNLCLVEPRVQGCTGGLGREVEQLLRWGRKGAGRQAAQSTCTAATRIPLLSRSTTRLT